MRRAALCAARLAVLCAPAALLGACGRGGPDVPATGAPRFELRAVVQPAIAAALARAPAPPAPVEPTADDRGATEAALESLGSADPRLRGLALEDLRGLGAAAVPVLAEVLADAQAEPARRTAAAQGLGAIASSAALDALARTFETSREPWVRAQCVYQLGSSGHDEVVVPLLLRMKYETDGETVVWMADALAKHGNPAGLDGLLVVARRDANDQVGALARERLSAIAQEYGFADGAALYAAWWHGDPDGRIAPHEPSDRLRLEAWRIVGRLAEWDLRRVDDARFVLVRLGDWIVPILCEALHEADVYTRVHAAQCLERRGERARGAVDALIAALAEPRVAPGAARALGAIRDARARAPLETALASARDLDLRTAAARALGALGQPAARAALRAAFDAAAEPPDLRQAAAAALLELGDADGTAAYLAERLRDPAGDPVGAELALEAWLRARAAADPSRADDLARWTALAPPEGTIPTAEESYARCLARAELVRGLLAR